jgi:hypothetical protein
MVESTKLIHIGSFASLPSIFTARPKARTRMRDFFNSHIRNPNTRRAYIEVVRWFSAFCADHGIGYLPIPPTKEQDIAQAPKQEQERSMDIGLSL